MSYYKNTNRRLVLLKSIRQIDAAPIGAALKSWDKNWRERKMGRFVLQFEDETKPFRQGRTGVAKAFFAARVMADALLVLSLVYLGWMYTMGDASPMHHFGRMI